MAAEPIEHVYCDTSVSSREAAAVKKAFSDAGFEVEVGRVFEWRSEFVGWFVVVVLATPFTAFFAELGSEAGKDTYVAVKEWVKAIWTARSESTFADHGSLLLHDPDDSTLELASRIPDEALDALSEIDWNEKRGDYLVWDDDKREWLDKRAS